jgi:hypothetical protein
MAPFFCKPIGWPTHLTTLMACALICWGARLPGGDLPYLFSGATLGAIVTLVWSARLAVRILLVVRHRLELGVAALRWGHWCISPILFAVLWLVVRSDLPFDLAFRMSRPSMQRIVSEVLADRELRSAQWIGVFPVSHVHVIPGGVEFTLDKKELLWGQRGFYYSNNGGPIENARYYDQKQIIDGWYAWHYGGW